MVKKELNKGSTFKTRNMSAVVDTNEINLSIPDNQPNINNFLDDSIIGPAALRKTLREKKGKVFGAGT